MAFARALIGQDAAQLGDLLDPTATLRAATPGRVWEGHATEEIVQIVLGTWFPPECRIIAAEDVTAGSVGDQGWTQYRLRVDRGSGPAQVQQSAYVASRDGLITELRVVCTGFRPADPD